MSVVIAGEFHSRWLRCGGPRDTANKSSPAKAGSDHEWATSSSRQEQGAHWQYTERVQGRPWRCKLHIAYGAGDVAHEDAHGDAQRPSSHNTLSNAEHQTWTETARLRLHGKTRQANTAMERHNGHNYDVEISSRRAELALASVSNSRTHAHLWRCWGPLHATRVPTSI